MPVKGARKEAAMNFDIGFGGALLAGLLSFLSPCVLPIVPPSLAFIAGMSFDEMENADGEKSWRVFRSALAFVLGFSTIFVLLGASASAVGQFLQEYREQIAWFAGAVIIILGLHFLGVFRIGLLYREARVQTKSKPVGFFGAYVVGLAFAFGWTPCVGPVLTTILMVAGAQDTALKGGLLLLAYALGIGLPFLLAALFMQRFMGFMKTFRKYLGLMEKIIGGFLVLTGILIMTGGMNRIGFWIQEAFPFLVTG